MNAAASSFDPLFSNRFGTIVLHSACWGLVGRFLHSQTAGSTARVRDVGALRHHYHPPEARIILHVHYSATVSALSFRIPRPESSRLSCLVIISCRTKTEEQRRVNCGRIQIIFQSINIIITHNIYHHQQYRISIIFNDGWVGEWMKWMFQELCCAVMIMIMIIDNDNDGWASGCSRNCARPRWEKMLKARQLHRLAPQRHICQVGGSYFLICPTPPPQLCVCRWFWWDGSWWTWLWKWWWSLRGGCTRQWTRCGEGVLVVVRGVLLIAYYITYFWFVLLIRLDL